MSTENPEKFSTVSAACVKQENDTETSVTPTSPTLEIPSQGSLSECEVVRGPSKIVLLVTGWWYMEFVCIFLCFGIFGFYCWFLQDIDCKSWDYTGSFKSIPLFSNLVFNNLPAALTQVSVVLKLLMFVPVSSAIGQLSWYRFWNTASRPVSDLQTFDAASRGLSGSVRLLLSRHVLNSLETTLASILTIAALYLGSSMQNAVDYSYPSEITPYLAEYQHFFTAAIPFVDRFDPDPQSNVIITDSKDVYIDPRMEASFYSAWLYRMNPQNSNKRQSSNISSFIPVNCTSAYCDWGKYTTLVVRSQCESVPAVINSAGFAQSDRANISSAVNVTGVNSTSTTVQSLLNLKASKTIPENSSFASSFHNQSAVIIHLAAISMDALYWAEAAECILHWEVQHFSNIRYNSSDSSLISNDTQHISPKTEQSTRDIIFEAPCNQDKENQTCIYQVDLAASRELQRPLADLFEGYVLPDREDKRHLRASTKATQVFASSWVDNAMVSSTTPLKSCLEEYMSNMAGGVSGNLFSTVGHLMVGQAANNGGRYAIKWYWTIYSGTMMVLSTYIFLFAVWKTRKMPVWKTSLLPFLYHGLQHPTKDDRYELSHLAWMEHASRNRRVTLRDEGDGLGLKLRDS
ncbi:hypothetical protein GQ607_012499 [Colletotrichum asianum]|uniref:Uncharacterized protein n=1 Tax=Colletotrichum asianum TaxID=702518 RepID=A0A8H3W8P7_9PEZI|nr:hypothetical protein GQ607_012499 [Colletotrichum asianum]